MEREADDEEERADGVMPSLGAVGRLQARLPSDSTVLYRTTIGFAAGYAVLVTASLLVGNTSLFSLGILFLVGSLISMYLDLLSLEVRLYDTRPILWLVGAVLMYFLVVPLYVYKRHQVT